MSDRALAVQALAAKAPAAMVGERRVEFVRWRDDLRVESRAMDAPSINPLSAAWEALSARAAARRTALAAPGWEA